MSVAPREVHTGFHDRLVLCVSCGGPLSTEVRARFQRCRHCGTENAVGLRLDDPVAAGWSADENARVEALRGQHPRLALDPLVASFAVEGRLASEQGAAAFAAWQRLRAEVAARPDREGALVDLTLLLAGAAGPDAARERALLESAFGLARTQRSRQLLAAALVDWSVRAGDLGAAQAWLSICDPRPAELASDGAYRTACALLATARGDARATLRALGGSPADLPFSARFAGPAAVLRADAWEKLGRMEPALDHLVYLHLETDAFVAQAARLFRDRQRRLELCKTTWDDSRRRSDRALAGTWGRIGAGALIVGFMGLWFVLFPVANVLWLNAGFEAWIGFSLWIPGLLLIPVAASSVRFALRTQKVAFHGEIAPARVLSTKVTVDDENPGMTGVEAVLLVVPDVGASFQITESFGTSPERAARVAGGSAHHVRVLGREVSLLLPL